MENKERKLTWGRGKKSREEWTGEERREDQREGKGKEGKRRKRILNHKTVFRQI